jgi:UDP:flavonoid glycosyltransferase YjiC (YdhE family)
MRVLFSSTWGYGHVFPMVPLARAFAEAGHDVLWATSELSCALVAAAGLPAVPAGLDAEGVAAVQRRAAAGTADLRPQDRAAFVFPTMFGEWATPSMVTDLLPLGREWRPDVMVHEQAELASPLVAAVLGVPSLTHSFGGAVPADFVAAAGERLTDLWSRHRVEQPPYAGCFGAPYLDICPEIAQTQSLEHIPRRQPLRPVAYTGEAQTPLPDQFLDDPRPLVYLTLGTLFNPTQVLAAAVAGLAELAARVLVTVGPNGDPAAMGPQPDHVHVVRWVRQSDVIPRCAAVVSHAGSGTFLAALSHGVPQLCLPQAADQFRNGAAVVASGAGLVLAPADATPAAITRAVGQLLTEPAFRAAALVVAEQISAMPSPDAVVRFIETDVQRELV